MERPTLKPGFYYDGDRIVDVNGKVVSEAVATGQAEEEIPSLIENGPDVMAERDQLKTDLATVTQERDDLKTQVAKLTKDLEAAKKKQTSS